MQRKSSNSESHSEAIARISKDDVGSRARGGVVWSIFQIAGRHIISIATTALLARILSPGDYGLVGMVATLTALLLVFSDMGLSWATVQRDQLTRIQVSNLFWVNIVAGGALWGVCALLAPVVSDFYRQPDLIAITTVMGASFLLSGIAVQPIALMQRQMRYKEIATMEVFSLLAGAGAGIASAIAGHGYWALVVQALVVQVVRGAIALPRSGLGVMAPRSGVNTASLLSFGGLIAINGLLIYLARNFDSVLIGRWWGSEALGHYNRAYFLMMLPSMLATGVLTRLMVPSLAAFQDDHDRFGAAYRRAVALVAFVGCPMAAGLALTAEEAVRLVYGEKWVSVAPMVVWLSIAGVTQPIYNTTGWLFTAAGKAKAYLLLTVMNAVVLVIGFFVAVSHGVLAVSAVYGVLMGVVLLGPSLWWAHKCVSIKLSETVKQLRPVFLCLVVMICAVMVVDWSLGLGELDWSLRLLVKVLVGVFFYAVCAHNFLPVSLKSEIFGLFGRKNSGHELSV